MGAMAAISAVNNKKGQNDGSIGGGTSLRDPNEFSTTQGGGKSSGPNIGQLLQRQGGIAGTVGGIIGMFQGGGSSSLDVKSDDEIDGGDEDFFKAFQSDNTFFNQKKTDHSFEFDRPVATPDFEFDRSALRQRSQPAPVQTLANDTVGSPKPVHRNIFQDLIDSDPVWKEINDHIEREKASSPEMRKKLNEAQIRAFESRFKQGQVR